MRRIIIALSFSLALAIGAAAQTDPFMPPNPITMGMGGAYTANAEGYNAFFYNPAGFAREAEFTLLSTNVYGVLDKKIYDLASQMISAAASGKDPMSALLPSGMGIGSRAAGDPSVPSIPGLDLPPETIESLTTTVTSISDYLVDVAESPNGDVALTAGFEALMSDPLVAQALEDAGVDTSDPAAMAELLADPTAAAAILVPVLLQNPEAIATLTDTFISTVETESGVAAPADVASAGASLQLAMDQVVASLTDFLPSGNANVGAMIGIGYVGNGLGLGLFANVNAGLYTPTGKSILSSTARASTFLTFAGGYAFTLAETLRIGFQVRPTILGYVSFMPASMLTQLLTGGPIEQDALIASIMSNGVYKGFRIGVDVGALWDIGDFTLGVALKDIIPNTELYMKYDAFETLIADLPNFKGAAAMAGAYQVPPLKMNIGVQWHPDLGVISDIVDPRVGIDLMDIWGWIRQLPGNTDEEKLAAARAKTAMMSDYDFLQMINVGAQVKFFKFITLSAGLGQGMAAAGLGLNLLVLDINASVGARYKFNADGSFASKAIDDFSEVAFSLEVAVLRL